MHARSLIMLGLRFTSVLYHSGGSLSSVTNVLPASHVDTVLDNLLLAISGVNVSVDVPDAGTGILDPSNVNTFVGLIICGLLAVLPGMVVCSLTNFRRLFGDLVTGNYDLGDA